MRRLLRETAGDAVSRPKIVIAAALFAAFSGTVNAQTTQRIGYFNTISMTDSMTDANRNAIIAGYSQTNPMKPVLVLACVGDGTTLDVSFAWNRLLIGNGKNISVAYRFPSQTLVDGLWGLDGSRRTGSMRPSQINGFVKAALANETVALRVTGQDGNSVTETFALFGLADALKTLPCAASLTMRASWSPAASAADPSRLVSTSAAYAARRSQIHAALGSSTATHRVSTCRGYPVGDAIPAAQKPPEPSSRRLAGRSDERVDVVNSFRGRHLIGQGGREQRTQRSTRFPWDSKRCRLPYIDRPVHE